MAEHIPDHESISRLIYWPTMYDDYKGLIWEIIFQFPSRPCESTVWRRYAPQENDVHHIGEDVEAVKRQRNPQLSYKGYKSAIVGDVRSIKTARGHGFVVNHEPDAGLHHSEICFKAADREGADALNKNDRNELKLLLRKAFDDEITTR
jgi:hypothetical protein